MVETNVIPPKHHDPLEVRGGICIDRDPPFFLFEHFTMSGVCQSLVSEAPKPNQQSKVRYSDQIS